MDRELFSSACQKVIGVKREQKLIGTLSEKTVHAVLKNYFEPYEDSHEVKLGSFYADIVSEDGIIEIQTRSLYRLKEKLTYFLAVSRVILVHPIYHTKYISWINGETGEVSEKRKSPKTGAPWDCFRELYGIKTLLKHPNLTICLPMLDICEYRNLDGWGSGGKRGSSRSDGIPTDLFDEIYLNTKEDYLRLIPQNLPDVFTTADFMRCGKTTQRTAGYALNILNYLDIIEKVGKSGKHITYKFKTIL